MSVLVTQLAVAKTSRRSRSTLLRKQIGVPVDAINHVEHALEQGDTVNGQSTRQLTVMIPDEFGAVDVTLTNSSGTIKLEAVSGFITIPSGVSYVIDYPVRTGAPKTTITVIAA